jgi:tetratricopeptide (TPR) repeat protein
VRLLAAAPGLASLLARRKPPHSSRYRMRMRTFIFALSLALAGIAAADDLVVDPVQYLKIVGESKLVYNIGEAAAKAPAVVVNCPRREPNMRVVADGKEKKLVAWDVKPEALTVLNEGDELWDKNDYDGAAEKFKASIATDPGAPTGYFFYGDVLLTGKGDAEAALAQYRKGIALDPTLPQGHFFAHTALVKLGRRDEAREEIVKALTYYPGYEAIWKIADKPERWNAKPVVRHRFDPPDSIVGKRQGGSIDVWGGPDGKWLMYAICKAAWANEPQFEKQHPAHGWSTQEERACVGAWLFGQYNKADQKPDKLDPLARYVWDVAQNKLLDGYVLFEIIGRHCPMALATLDDESRDLVERYIRKYVIVSAGK